MALEPEEIDALACLLWLSKVYSPSLPLTLSLPTVAGSVDPVEDVSTALGVLIENEVDVDSIRHFQSEDFEELKLSIHIQREGLKRYTAGYTEGQRELLDLIEFLCAAKVSNLLQCIRQCVEDEMDVETFVHFTTADFEESGVQLGDRLKIWAELKARGLATGASAAEQTGTVVPASASDPASGPVSAALSVSSPVTPVRDRDALSPKRELEREGAEQHRGLARMVDQSAAPNAAVDGGREKQKSERSVGTIQWYDETKRFGFVKPDLHEKDVFIHKADVALLPPHLDRSKLKGTRVTFEIKSRDGREVAVNLTVADESQRGRSTQSNRATHREVVASGQSPGSPNRETEGHRGIPVVQRNIVTEIQRTRERDGQMQRDNWTSATDSPAVSLLWHGVGASCTCPLSGNPLVDPVIAPDGVTYERASIEAWLEGNTHSPADRSVAVAKSDLIPNVSMLRLIASTAEALDGMKREIEAKEAQLRNQRDGERQRQAESEQHFLSQQLAISESQKLKEVEREQQFQAALQQNATLAAAVARQADTERQTGEELLGAQRTIADLQARLATVTAAMLAQTREQKETDRQTESQSQVQVQVQAHREADSEATIAPAGLRRVHPATQQLVSSLDGLLVEASAAQVARAAALVRAELQGNSTQQVGNAATAIDTAADSARLASRAARKAEYLDSMTVALQLNADVEVYSHKYAKWLQGKVVSLSGTEAKVEYCGRTKRVNISDYGSLRLAREWVHATGHSVPDMSDGLVLGEGEGILRHIVES